VILWSADKAVPSHLLVAVEVDIIQIDAQTPLQSNIELEEDWRKV